MSLSLSEVRTDDVAPEDRIAFWEEVNAHTLFGLRCSTFNNDLSLSSGQRRVDGLQLTEVKGSPHVVDRSGSHLASEREDSLMISVLLEGSGFFHGPHGTSALRAGEAMTYSTSDAHLFGFDTDLRLLIVDVPLETLRLEWGWDPPAAPSHLGRERVATLAASFAQLASGPHTPEARIGELVRVTLRPATASPHATYLRAMQAIRERLSHPDLTPDAVAARLGLSARQLHRVFAAEGTSPARSLLLTRLEAAQHELVHRRDLSLTDIAGRSGFSSPSHFARAYRREYGLAPSAAREEALASE